MARVIHESTRRSTGLDIPERLGTVVVLASSTVDDSKGSQPPVKAKSQGRQSCPSREARGSREPQVRLRSTGCHGKDAKGRAPGVRQLAPSGQVPWTDSGIRRLQTRTGQR